MLHFYYDAQSKPSIVIYDSTPYAYLYNLQGDVIALVDGTGAKVVEYTYDAWGKVLSTTGSLASTLGTVQPFRYRGYVYDVETGFYYLRSRYYNPIWQRFCNADILMSNNLYAYCGNKPVSKADRDGKKPEVRYGYVMVDYVSLQDYPQNIKGERVEISTNISGNYHIKYAVSEDRYVEGNIDRTSIFPDNTYSLDALEKDYDQIKDAYLSIKGGQAHENKTRILECWLNRYITEFSTRNGGPISVTGNFDVTVELAVMSFQKEMNGCGLELKVDGIAGPKTIKALYLCLQDIILQHQNR